MATTVIAVCAVIGLLVIAAIQITIMISDRDHQRWIEDNNRRRFALADAEKARAKAIRNAK
jgi:hypothetical protein